MYYFSFLYIVNLKRLCVSKVLKNLSVFICYCYSHYTLSFFHCIFLIKFLLVTSSKIAVTSLTIADSKIPAFNSEWMSVNKCICYFFSGNLVNSLNRCSCNLHRFSTLLLTITFLVQKTDCLILIDCQNNGSFFLIITCRKKFQNIREMADFSAFYWSWHKLLLFAFLI